MEGNCGENIISKLKEEEEDEEKEYDDEKTELEIMKRRISCHPLFGILVKAHLDCLQVSSGETGGLVTSTLGQSDANADTIGRPKRTEIDDFMEAYCVALRELGEVMKESVQETAGFINTMHFQLNQLMPSNLSTANLTSRPTGDSGDVSRGEESNRVCYLRQQQQDSHVKGRYAREAIKVESFTFGGHHGLSSWDDTAASVMMEEKED